MQANIFHLHALSALHCGTGQSAGVVDLPIARARASNIPLVPGSSLRGVLRAEIAASAALGELETALFGPRSIDGPDGAYAGAMAVGDAHLLLLPVRALSGVVAYASCPFILRRYAADLARAGAPVLAVPEPPDLDTALHGADSVSLIDGKIVLEDLDLIARQSDAAGAWAAAIANRIFAQDEAAQDDLRRRFLILPDAVFSFLCETATEIRARTAIDQKSGTVKPGALWYEENLPAESILWGVFAISDARGGVRRSAAGLAAALPSEQLLQLGGKAGVGRGLTRIILRGDQ